MIVVDTSVAVQWVSEESTSDLADALLARDDLAAPDFMLVEAANALYRKVFVGEASQEHVAAGLQFIRDRVELFPVTVAALSRAIAIAEQMHHRSIFDCLFVALAEANDGLVVTWDQDLHRHAHQRGFAELVSHLPLDEQ